MENPDVHAGKQPGVVSYISPAHVAESPFFCTPRSNIPRGYSIRPVMLINDHQG